MFAVVHPHTHTAQLSLVVLDCLGCCFHLNWNQIKVFSLTKWNCAFGIVLALCCLQVSILFDSIRFHQRISVNFLGICLLMTSYCSTHGKVSLPILHSICWLFCGSLFHQLFIRKSYSHLPRAGICNCALSLSAYLCATHLCLRFVFIIYIIQSRIISANKHAYAAFTAHTKLQQGQKSRTLRIRCVYTKSRNKTQINCIQAL